MKTKFKKILAALTITTLVFTQVATVTAFEAPTPPPEPILSEFQTPPPPPSEPTPPPEPVVPTLENLLAPSPSPSEEEPENTSNEERLSTSENPVEPPISTTPLPLSENSDSSDLNPSYSGPEANGNVGDTTLDTGNATTTGEIITSANDNLAATTPSNSDGGASITNSGNGSGSNNSATTNGETSINTIQDNTGSVGNSLTLDSTSGSSSASKNVGDTNLTTGDANTSGTVVTQLNSNLAGVAVSEFNVVDDQLGDLVLDFASNCILGCDIFSNTSVQNIGNGSESTNSADLTQDLTNDTFQNNIGNLENEVLLTSNSGDNTADKNTGGDTTLTTGDANASANVLSFLNNNVAGNVLLGVVNIFGDLIGDIILPSLGSTSTTTVANVGNGTESTNDATLNQSFDSNTFQTNDAEIINNLNLQATTGDNQASKNTGGNTAIETGDADVVAQVLNIANSNINAGDWWLVLVNEAGEWVGKIIGAPTDSNFAGSEGTQFSVDTNGDITAQNIGNGSGSQNTATIDQTTSQTTVQNNVARILNNINIFANTGGNSASSNTGGNTTISTGDANVVANLVNFVNNNIVGSGKLTVVTINVFGRWVGDFLSPGQKKEEAVTNNTTNNNNSSNDAVTPLAASSSNPESQNNQRSSNTQTQTAPPTNTPPSAGSALVASHVVRQALTQATEPVETQVAGIQLAANDLLSDLQDETLGKKKVNINLAWGLLLLPLAVLGFVVRRKMLSLRGKGYENSDA